MARWDAGLNEEQAGYVGKMRAAHNDQWREVADTARRENKARAGREAAQAQGYGGAYSQQQSQRYAERGEDFEPEESRVSTADEIRGAGGSVYVGTVEVEYEEGRSDGTRAVNSHVSLDDDTLEAIENGEMSLLEALNESGVMAEYGAPMLTISSTGGVSW
jgi:hypothetical protein